MSKVVKKVGRAIGKVVKGVVNGVKKFAKSKLGKIIIMAAAVYFGGAALMGAMGTSGAAAAGGLSGLSGAAANVGAAWSSLGTAASAAMGGEFATAGSALASGATGTAAAGGSALAGAGASAATGATTGMASSMPAYNPVTSSFVNPVAGASTAVNAAAAAPAATTAADAIAGAMKTGTYVQAGLTGAQMLMNAKAGQAAEEEQQAARDRYNANVGANWWGQSSGGGSAPMGTSPYAQPAQSGLIAGAMTPQQRYAEMMRLQQMTYDPYNT